MTKDKITTYYNESINDIITNGNYSDEEKDLLERLNKYDGQDIEDIIFGDDSNNIVHEIADSSVDIYHADRFKWLCADYNNSNYVDDAVIEYGYNFNNFNLSDLIALGQFKYYFDMLNELINELNGKLREYSDNDNE